MSEVIYPYVVLGSRKYGDIALNGVFTTDFGMEAVAGMSGLGLPPVSVQWREAAGDGSMFRGKRVLSRDLDVPIYVRSKDREDLKAQMSHLALVLSDEVELRFVESETLSWYCKAHRMGGGEYVYGSDTQGEDDLMTVVTFRSGDPFWTRSQTSTVVVGGNSDVTAMIGDTSLVGLSVASSQTFGRVTLSNPGDADAYPVWTVMGPGTNFKASIGDPEATDGSYTIFNWAGTLAADEVLTIDTYTGLVTDQDGINRYADFDAAPRFWKIPPGNSEAMVTLEGANSSSRVECTWRPRKWLVV